MATNNDISILITGTGFSGICVGIQLKKAGFHNFKIVEKANDVGGTWRDNHYPGAACDVKSNLYSFSFEPNPNCVNYVNKLIEVNHIENCTIYPVGLSEKIGFETLYADNEVASGATMLKDFRINYQTPSPTNCPCTLLEISLRV